MESHLILRPVTEEIIVEPPTPDMNDVLWIGVTDEHLRSESPTHQISPLDSSPLFARGSEMNNRLERTHENIGGSADVGCTAGSDVVPTFEHATEQVIEEEGSLHGQHMEVANG